MQYSLVNGQKTAASPGLYGTCECCNVPTYSACGKIIKWHWRHINKCTCDLWWENETQWHRDWKNQFPKEWREVISWDSLTNEKHIADIQTPNGLTIEFQNSLLSIEEMQSRENFYGNLIWIVNAKKFEKNVNIGFRLPSPDSSFPKEIDFSDSDHYLTYDITKSKDGFREYDPAKTRSHIKMIDYCYTNHHRVTWNHNRKVWLMASYPVYFDFGDELLWRIEKNARFNNFYIASYFYKEEFVRTVVNSNL